MLLSRYQHNQVQRSKFIKQLSLVITCLSAVLTTQLASAETVMEKVARTGVLTAGTSKDAIPFAYANEQGKLVGYSVDMLTLIQQQLAQELGREIKLELVALEPQQRIPQLINHDVDIVCDASSFTWERERKIDFSVSYFITGTRLLVKQNDALDFTQSLANKRIGILPGTTSELAIKKAETTAQLIYVSDRNEGYSALKQGTIDAFADDGILLESWVQASNNRQSFSIVGYYSQEGIACMVPENNSQLLNTVNYTLIRFMQSFLAEKPDSINIFDRWFGVQGIVPLSEDLRDLMLESMQLIIDSKETIPL